MIFRWDIFNKICNIYFGFLEYILPNFTDKIHYTNERGYAWFSELAFCIITALIYNNERIIQNFDNHYYCNLILKDNDNNLDKILKWSFKNNRTNAALIIISDNDNLINEINSEYKYFLYATNNINELKKLALTIELKINEYVKCLDPIEFRNENYTIEKFDN